MCGIAGILKFNSVINFAEIKRFTDSLTHRGIDGYGYQLLEDDTVALGHRRLSVLDLTEGGKQPMSYANGRYWITYNGEIYNFLEIKSELITYGYKFCSTSDTEVILSAFHKWGVDCFNKFNGMWAMAIWDVNEKELLLCRDRFGVKPLHYFFIPKEIFAFASETHAFKYLDNYKRQFSSENLYLSIEQQNMLEATGETIFKNTYQLLPGHFMLIKNNVIKEQKQWWKIDKNLPRVPKNFPEQVEEFHNLFADACKLRLRSDVPIASALSGGLDSTSVYCMVRNLASNEVVKRLSKEWQKAFSISFPSSENDERQYVEQVLNYTKGTGIIVEPDNRNLIRDIESSTNLSDMITGTPLSCLTYVYKAMRDNNIVVSLDGHGADEYLYGYQSSVNRALVDAYVNNDLEYAENIENTLMEMSGNKDVQQVFISAKKNAAQLKMLRQKPSNQIKKLVKKVIPNQPNKYTLPQHAFSPLFIDNKQHTKHYPSIYTLKKKYNNQGEQKLYEEFHYTDLPYNLRDFDRGAMQHHIEIRMPFMDYRLVTYCMALPQKSKLNNGYTKYILREAMKNLIPEAIYKRKRKIGLSAPLADWFNGSMNTYVLDLIHSNKLTNLEFLNIPMIKENVTKNCKNKSWAQQNANELWPVLNYLLLSENI
ncbi:MAG: asparagine synthase (glutamine-hydrolyzing) [Bacteroidia bacterium]